MSDWKLLIIEGSAHLVNLDSKITEIKDFGNFPTEILHNHEPNIEFELFDKKAKIVTPVQSDLQSNLKRGPQIISPKDIAWIVYKSGIISGDTVIEAGSGSGALTLALIQTVAPNGQVVTFENNSKHFKIAKRNVSMSPWSKMVEIREEELNNTTEIIPAASIVLDLPNPWDIISWAKKSLRVGGFLICYLPTVNQVQKLVEALEGWQEVEIVETIQRSWQSKQNALRPHSSMLGHTGFIISARWND